MSSRDQALSELERTNALLEELYPQLQSLAARALTASPADLPQIEAEQLADVDIVLDDEDAFRHFKTPLLRRSRRHCFSLFYHTRDRVHEHFVKNHVSGQKRYKSVCQPLPDVI